MSIEIYVLLVWIFTMFFFGFIACIGWNIESRKNTELKRENRQLRHDNRLLEFEVSRANVTKDILAINEEVETND